MTLSSHSVAPRFPCPLTPRAQARAPLADRERERAKSSRPRRRGQARVKEPSYEDEAMSYKHTAEKLADYHRQIGELRQKMRDVQAAVEPEAVKDYTFRRASGGSVRLSELFGEKVDLFVIHNMGQSCPYCTL